MATGRCFLLGPLASITPCTVTEAWAPHGLLGQGRRWKGGNHSPRELTHPELRLHSVRTPHTHCHAQAGGPQLHHQPGGEYRACGWPLPWSFQPQRPRAGVGTSARSQGSLATQQSGLASPSQSPTPGAHCSGSPGGAASGPGCRSSGATQPPHRQP